MRSLRMSMPRWVPLLSAVLLGLACGRYMANDEPNFLMEEIGRLERAGRVEALRENRNCFHVFVFSSGKRPPERAIAVAKAEILAGQEEAEPEKPVKRKPQPHKRTARKR